MGRVVKNPTKPGRARRHVAGYGTAMSQLTPMQRRFVEILYKHPHSRLIDQVTLAGYKGKYDATRKMGERLMRNPLVLDAIREAGETIYRGKLPKTMAAIDNIIK